MHASSRVELRTLGEQNRCVKAHFVIPAKAGTHLFFQEKHGGSRIKSGMTVEQAA